DFFSERPAICPSPGRKLWYSVAVPVPVLQLQPRLLRSTRVCSPRVLRRGISAAPPCAPVSPPRRLLPLLPALLSSSVLSAGLVRLWVAEVLRSRVLRLRSLTAAEHRTQRSTSLPNYLVAPSFTLAMCDNAG